MKLTQRGRIVAGVTVVGFLWAATFGIQAMNAVVLPAVVVLLAGLVIVGTSSEPSVRREVPEPGFPDEVHTVHMEIDVGRSATVFVTDELPAAVEPVEEAGAYARAGAVDYRIRPTRRGVHEIGPVVIEIRDPFGLFTAEHAVDARVELVTYPAIEELPGLKSDPALLPRGAPQRERYEFDNLREYHRGDAIRDIHWKSSAKRPGEDLVVKQFISNRDAGDIRIAGSADSERVDEMASACGSIAVALLKRGMEVGLTLPNRDVDVGSGSTHWMEILAALARTSGGRLPQHVSDESSIVVRGAADDAAVQVRIGGTWRRYEELRSGQPESTASATAPIVTDGGTAS